MSNTSASALSTEDLDSGMYLHCPKMQQKRKAILYLQGGGNSPFFLANIGSFMH